MLSSWPIDELRATASKGCDHLLMHFRGALIGLKRPFSGIIMASSTSGKTRGPWVNLTNRCLGLKFVVKGQVHFGWVRFNVSHQREGYGAFTLTLTGYAYEAIPNKPILAGEIRGPDNIVGQPTPISLRTPTSAPATLGLLALGARRLSIWRRKGQD